MIIESSKVRWLVISGVMSLALWWSLPNFFQAWWLPKEKLVYGLDIQGGLHLVLGVNVEDVLDKKLNRSTKGISEYLKEEGVTVQKSEVRGSNIYIQTSNARLAQEKIKEEYGSTFRILNSKGNQLTLTYLSHQEDQAKKDIISQSIEVIRNRIDEFGVNEPVIVAQGETRVLVQLPGVKEAEKARELIQKTAFLELMLVSEKIKPEDLIKMISAAERKGNYSFKEGSSYRKYIGRLNKDLKLPENTRVVFSKDEVAESMQAGRTPLLVETDTGLTGDMLDDASVGVGQFGEPVVNFKFGVEGRKRFSEVTSKNIGRMLAIVLDGVTKTAPQIKDHMTDRGQISLGSQNREEMMEEAQMISTTLRAGALPTQLELLEERTVGPSLGRDYVEKGKNAIIIATILILIFLLIYYRWLGFVADISLCFNIICLMAFLTSFSATLTLPGIAGIILTIGMAVDANIIIFERLKEELRKGSSIKLSIQEGFGRAFSAILDANITTAIVCLILMYFGTGPIRGFAVTLFFGIITSVFTSIFVSRTLLQTLVHRFKIKIGVSS